MSADLREHLCGAATGPAGQELGEGREHLLESLVPHLPHPEQLDALREHLLRDERAGRVRLDLATRGGVRLSVEASAFAVDSETPDSPHYVVIARPIENTAPREVRVGNDPLSQIVASAPHGVLVTDTLGFVSYANTSAAELLGCDRDDLVGSPIGVHLPHSRGFEHLLEKLREPAGWDGEEIERFDSHGRSSWMSVSTRSLEDLEGHPAGVVAYLRDITERREVQRQLERKNQELESYVDSVAHDLRSPLVSLLGFTRLIKQDYEAVLDGTGRHFLDRVEEAGRTMDALIRDLLELSRIRSSAEVLPFTDPRRILLQVEAELKLRLEANRVSLELPDAPPLMRVDGTRLYQVFSNLIGNALTHGFAPARGSVPAQGISPDQLEPGCVRIEVLERDNGHEVVVCDNGRGIPEEDQARIFQVFQTGRGVQREHSHGIGLAIVKKITEAHGGRVWVESTPGSGARFHLHFPTG